MQKIRKENQRGMTVLWFALFVVFLTIIMTISSSYASKALLKNYNEVFESTNPQLVYIGRPTCSYCQLLEPGLKDLSSRYEFDYLYLDIDKLSELQLDEALTKAGIDASTFGTPYLIVIKDGKKVAEQVGYVATKKLFEFLQVNSVIADDVTLTFENDEMLSEYDDAIKSTTNKLIFVGGSATCTQCATVTSTLESFDEDYNLEYFTLNYDEMTNAELQTELGKLNIANADDTAPYVIIAKDGKKVAQYSGEMTQKGLFNFVKSYSLIPSDAELIIEKIGYSEFSILLNGSEPQVVVIGSIGCSHCEEAYPVLKNMIKEYDLNIKYLELSYLNSDENAALGNIMANVDGGTSTPNMLIVKDGKVIANSVGFIDQETYVKFLQDNNILSD